MTEQSMFFEDGTYYDQVVFARFPKDIVGHNGVVHNTDNELQVVANTPANMAVQVKTGRAWINGYIYEILTDPVNLTIEEADPSQDRIDRVVLHLNVTAPRGVSVKVLKGTPGGSEPALTQIATVWEEPLCKVRVPAGTLSIVQGYITDERDYMWFTEANQPKASASRYGAVKVGTGIDVTDGVISLSPYGAVPIKNVSNTNTNGFEVGESTITVPAYSWDQKPGEMRTFYDAYTITGLTYQTKNCPPFVIMSGTGSVANISITHKFVDQREAFEPDCGLRALDSNGNILATIEHTGEFEPYSPWYTNLTLNIPVPYGESSIKIQYYTYCNTSSGSSYMEAGTRSASTTNNVLYYNPVVTP